MGILVELQLGGGCINSFICLFIHSLHAIFSVFQKLLARVVVMGVRAQPRGVCVSEICKEQSPVLEVAQYRDLSLSGCVYSQVRIMAIVEAFWVS